MYTPGDPRHENFLRDWPRQRAMFERADPAMTKIINGVSLDFGGVISRGNERVAMDMLQTFGYAMDAQPQLSTTPNSGIPAWMSYYVDPDIWRILFSPLEAANIAGQERKIGTWTTTTSLFPLTEWGGQVTSYGDFVNGGMATANATFPQRQSYHYQVIVEYGEREVEMVALAKINLVAEKKESAAWNLNAFQNNSYFFGVQSLQCYGILNDPSLSAALQPGPKAYNSQAHGPWITNGVITATPNEIYTDILSLFIQIQQQANGVVTIDNMSEIVVAMHPTSQTAFKQANIYGVSAEKLVRENFPNFKLMQAVQYATTAATPVYSVQMIARKVQNQQTMFVGFTEKLRAHRIVQEMSGWKQKTSQGTWGAVIRNPFAISSMAGI